MHVRSEKETENAEFLRLARKDLVALTIDHANDKIHFETDDGKRYVQYHSQDCCEGVSIEDVNGDVADMIGTPILSAEESTNSETYPDGVEPPKYADDSFTWTFYRLRTIKGSMDIRWFGSSNGYYSESVDFRVEA